MEIKIKVTAPPKDAIMKAAIEAVKKQISAKLKNVECPEHHQRPTLVINGRDLKNVQIEGCCQNVIDQAKKALS